MNDIEIPEHSRLKDWRALLECWQATLAQILAHTHGEDAPYMHGEHGNNHLLAAAASRVPGMSSMREMIGYRHARQGRLDICLLSDARLDLVESKYHEFNLGRGIAHQNIERALQLARADALSYRNEHGLFTSERKSVRRIGIAFIVPYFRDRDHDVEALAELVDFIRTKVPHDALACSFPQTARALRYSGGRLHSGVIAIASVASEASSARLPQTA